MQTHKVVDIATGKVLIKASFWTCKAWTLARLEHYPNAKLVIKRTEGSK